MYLTHTPSIAHHSLRRGQPSMAHQSFLSKGEACMNPSQGKGTGLHEPARALLEERGATRP